MKQVLWSMAVVMISMLLLAGMVVYTVSVMRTVQMQILTGEHPGVMQTHRMDETLGPPA